jgi:hypothetical protein
VNMITQAADRIMDIAEMNIKTEGQGQCTWCASPCKHEHPHWEREYTWCASPYECKHPHCKHEYIWGASPQGRYVPVCYVLVDFLPVWYVPLHYVLVFLCPRTLYP